MIVSALVSLVTGFFLVVGLGGGVLVVKVLDDKLKDEPPRRYRPPGILYTPIADSAVIETSVVRDVPKFSVRGSIRNIEAVDWDVGTIRVEMLSKATPVGTCEETGNPDYRILKPGQTINFLVICQKISPPPKGETFDYRIRAERWEDQKK